jgi:hypothetical protein
MLGVGRRTLYPDALALEAGATGYGQICRATSKRARPRSSIRASLQSPARDRFRFRALCTRMASRFLSHGPFFTEGLSFFVRSVRLPSACRTLLPPILRLVLRHVARQGPVPPPLPGHQVFDSELLREGQLLRLSLKP